VRDGSRLGRTGRLIARAALALGAVVAALWLAGNLRSVERTREASVAMGRAVAGGARPADLDAAHRLFARARRFGPDTTLKVDEAGILVLGRSKRRAAPLIHQAVREEPDNVQAWVLSYGLANGPHDPLAVRARRQVKRLDPRALQLLDRVDAAR
jgi:hypothetical protein